MPKVMLVEDDDIMLSLLHTLLQIEGFDVDHLLPNEDVTTALENLREDRPDVVLLDVHLGNLNGFDLLHSLRADEGLKDTRVLMSSGMDFSLRCYQEGADGFILKPYMPEELIKKIQGILEGQGSGKRD